jgi:hypothetical protein
MRRPAREQGVPTRFVAEGGPRSRKAAHLSYTRYPCYPQVESALRDSVCMTPIGCGQGARLLGAETPDAAAQADRIAFRGVMGSGRRGRLTKPPPCGRCGLPPSIGEGGWLRRAARRNQRLRLHGTAKSVNRRGLGPAGDPNGTGRLRPDGTGDPAKLRLRRDPDETCGSFGFGGKRPGCGQELRLRKREPNGNCFGASALNGDRTGRLRCLRASPLAPGGKKETPGRVLRISNPPKRQKPCLRARREPDRRSEGWRKRQPSSHFRSHVAPLVPRRRAAPLPWVGRAPAESGCAAAP